METITIRINIKDWRRLRRLIPARKSETYAEYMSRIIKKINK
jgi:hypothetical protein